MEWNRQVSEAIFYGLASFAILFGGHRRASSMPLHSHQFRKSMQIIVAPEEEESYAPLIVDFFR